MGISATYGNAFNVFYCVKVDILTVPIYLFSVFYICIFRKTGYLIALTLKGPLHFC